MIVKNYEPKLSQRRKSEDSPVKVTNNSRELILKRRSRSEMQ